MNNKLKKAVIVLGLGTFSVGIMTSLSSFGVKAATATGTPCYDSQNLPDCPANTNFTLTINGTNADNVTFNSTSSPTNITVGGLGFTLSFPKKSGSGSTTITGSNGYSYTLTQTVTNNYEILCNTRTSPGGQACARVDCKNNKIQTYTCASPGTGSSTGSSASPSIVAW